MAKKIQPIGVSEEAGKAIREAFVEKELLQASIVQRELVAELKDLWASLKVLDQTLNLIKEHEFVELHSSKWKIFAYQIGLGVLFAFGTVFGLVFLSWTTYTFFKDSEVLRWVIDNQLKIRQFDIKEIKEKAKNDVSGSQQVTLTEQTVTVTVTGTGSATATGTQK